jgi:hypothetical protein
VKCFLVICLTFVSVSTLAQSVQVPENCINRISPCLVRTEEAAADFVQSGYKVHMLKQTIIKMTFEDKKLDIDLLEGQLKINSSKKPIEQLSLREQEFSGARILYAKRFDSDLSVLRLDDFKISEFEATTGNEDNTKKIRSNFATKNDLIEFTRTFFSTVPEYKKFLGSIQGSWKKAFERENSNQTKVLMRSVASINEAAAAETARKAVESKKLKKVRDEFFYRTFER